MFIIVDNSNNIVAWAYKRVDAIGNKEYMERKGMTDLAIKHVYNDTDEYREAKKKIFNK